MGEQRATEDTTRRSTHAFENPDTAGTGGTMTIAVAIRVTVLTSAWVLGTATIADAEPVRAANDEIVCFVHAIEPWKTDHGSMAPINYGFKVHCTGPARDAQRHHEAVALRCCRREVVQARRTHRHQH
ncbi:hypothetical protein [Nocardia exalbida]|uniref:hypothetical protein n=1 Tax=Nocardia exalbida TaxID=290231 RepID=UPI0012F6B5E2|nr:hypothetical protein [Nocardia exalbida]